jgi:hypothetical protein
LLRFYAIYRPSAKTSADNKLLHLMALPPVKIIICLSVTVQIALHTLSHVVIIIFL